MSMHLLQMLHSMVNGNTGTHTNSTSGRLIHTNTSYINLKTCNIKCPDFNYVINADLSKAAIVMSLIQEKYVDNVLKNHFSYSLCMNTHEHICQSWLMG